MYIISEAISFGRNVLYYESADCDFTVRRNDGLFHFPLNSYEENKKRFPGEKERAMGHAIANTFKSVVGSSVTTIAGFAALCAMTFTLGRDLGIVMAKVLLWECSVV